LPCACSKDWGMTIILGAVTWPDIICFSFLAAKQRELRVTCSRFNDVKLLAEFD
jgi:hypothetical protein